MWPGWPEEVRSRSVTLTCVYLQPLRTTNSQRLTTVGTKTIGTVGTKIFGKVVTKTITSVSSRLSISSPRSQQTHRDSHVPISPSPAQPVHHTYSWRKRVAHFLPTNEQNLCRFIFTNTNYGSILTAIKTLGFPSWVTLSMMLVPIKYVNTV